MAGGAPAEVLPSRVDAVLFDAGGVLLDLDFAFLRRVIGGHHAEVTESELSGVEARARLEINRGHLDAGPAGNWRDFFYLVLGRVGVPPEEHDTIIDTLWEAHHRVGLWTVAVPGGPEAVAGLGQRGIRVGVVSNAEGQVARDLAAAGYGGAFETIVDSHLVGVRKPDPEIFRIALERMNIDAARTVYLGDMPVVDVEGARAAGVAPILFDRHGFYEDLDVLRIAALDQLPRLFGKSDS